MPREKIWTVTWRDLLYGSLLQRFGPYHRNILSKKEFKDFRNDFARNVGAKSGKAVEHQVRFAVAGQGLWRTEGMVANAVLNVAA
jgi:hypothetical protein